jgi:hypothetical protein
MEMLLMILGASVPVFVLCVLVFKATEPRGPQEKPVSESRPELTAALPAPRFFAGEPTSRLVQSRYPLEAVLSQIERHVRLEQAAAENFLDVPTPASLHSRTTSPFLN